MVLITVSTFAIWLALSFSTTAGVAQQFPEAGLQPTWTCDYDTVLNRGEWGINIVPWWAVHGNIKVDVEWFEAYVVIYSQSQYVERKCDAIKYPLACSGPTDTFNFTAKDLGEEKTIHVNMGTACKEMDRNLRWQSEREDVMLSGNHNFQDVAISIGEDHVWVDVDMEVKRTAGEAAGKGMCRRWGPVDNAEMRAGAICTFSVGE